MSRHLARYANSLGTGRWFEFPIRWLEFPIRQIERIQQLPRTQQKFVMQMLDTVLAQQGR